MAKSEFPQADRDLVARSLRMRAWLYAAMGLPARTSEHLSHAHWADIVASTEIVKRGEAQGERWQRIIRALGGAGGSATVAWYALGEAEQDATQWQLFEILGAISHMTLIAMTGGSDAPKAKQDRQAKAKDRKAKAPRARSRKGPSAKAKETNRSRKANAL